MNDLTLQVDGMTCAVCVGNVERTLKDLPFVANPSVNLAAENAKVSLDEVPNFGEVLDTTILVGPIPGEKTADNNQATYQLQFSL